MPSIKRRSRKSYVVCRPLNLSQSFRSSSLNSTLYKSSLKINNKELAKELEETRLRLRHVTNLYLKLVTLHETRMCTLSSSLFQCFTKFHETLDSLGDTYKLSMKKDLTYSKNVKSSSKKPKKRNKLSKQFKEIIINSENNKDDDANDYEDIDEIDDIIQEQHNMEDLIPENIEEVEKGSTKKPRKSIKSVTIFSPEEIESNSNSIVIEAGNSLKASTLGIQAQSNILKNKKESNVKNTVPLNKFIQVSKVIDSPKALASDKELVMSAVPATNKKLSNLPLYNKRKSLNGSMLKNIEDEAVKSNNEGNNTESVICNTNIITSKESSSATNKNLQTERPSVSTVDKHNNNATAKIVKANVSIVDSTDLIKSNLRNCVTKETPCVKIVKTAEHPIKKTRSIIDKTNTHNPAKKPITQLSTDNAQPAIKLDSVSNNLKNKDDSCFRSPYNKRVVRVAKNQLTDKKKFNIEENRRGSLVNVNRNSKSMNASTNKNEVIKDKVDVIAQIGSDNYEKEIILFARKDKIPRTPIKADKVENSSVPPANISSIDELSSSNSNSNESLPDKSKQIQEHKENVVPDSVLKNNQFRGNYPMTDAKLSAHQVGLENNGNQFDKLNTVVLYDNGFADYSLDASSNGLLNMDEINSFLDIDQRINNESDSVYSYLKSQDIFVSNDKGVHRDERIIGNNILAKECNATYMNHYKINSLDKMPNNVKISDKSEFTEGSKENKIFNMNISTATQLSVATNESSHVSFSNLQRVTKRYNAPNQDSSCPRVTKLNHDQDSNWLTAIGIAKTNPDPNIKLKQNVRFKSSDEIIGENIYKIQESMSAANSNEYVTTNFNNINKHNLDINYSEIIPASKDIDKNRKDRKVTARKIKKNKLGLTNNVDIEDFEYDDPQHLNEHVKLQNNKQFINEPMLNPIKNKYEEIINNNDIDDAQKIDLIIKPKHLSRDNKKLKKKKVPTATLR